jgi:hypothetical protein
MHHRKVVIRIMPQPLGHFRLRPQSQRGEKAASSLQRSATGHRLSRCPFQHFPKRPSFLPRLLPRRHQGIRTTAEILPTLHALTTKDSAIERVNLTPLERATGIPKYDVILRYWRIGIMTIGLAWIRGTENRWRTWTAGVSRSPTGGMCLHRKGGTEEG